MNSLELVQAVRRRLLKKFQAAERAYVNQFIAKATLNCKHHGRKLAEKIHHCKINAMGDYQGDGQRGASCCWDEKAALCPLFELKRTLSQLKVEFKDMFPEERSLRWPALGELIWVEFLLRNLGVSRNGGDVHQSNSGQPCSEVKVTDGVTPESFQSKQSSGSSSSEGEKGCEE